MKKTISFLSLFLVLSLLLVGCENKKEKEAEYLIDIDYATFISMVNNGNDFIVEVVQTGCSNCTAFSPKFEAVLTEYQITAYSLNISEFSDTDRNTFIEKLFIDEKVKSKPKNIVQPLVEKVKSIIKK